MTPEPRASVLLVDDRLEMAEMLADGLRDRGYDATALASSRDALAFLEREPVDALVTDLRMPDVDGIALLEASRRLNPARPVIVMTAFGAIDTAIESMRRGASHYLTKPFKLDELHIFLERVLADSRLRRESASLRSAFRERFSPAGFIGESRAVQDVLDVVQRVAQADTPVLLTGETGTGKGVLAKILHAESRRSERPFVAVNCAALPEALLESELFGHTKGAFTGAVSSRAGLFAEADGGTIFLDEIGEMPLSLQAKLLHVLESNTVRPVGASREKVVDFRVVAATHRDLRERAHAGTFRTDLLYRLDVVPIEIPPLRQRREDLPALLAHFLRTSRARHPGSKVESFGDEALTCLLQYEWPGNVRELAHMVERMVLLARGHEVMLADLPAALRATPARQDLSFGDQVLPIREVQRRYAAWALEQCQGHRGRTAEQLGVDAKTLAKWLSEGSSGSADDAFVRSSGT